MTTSGSMVAILGTGPAGMMAAHACALRGQMFALFGLPDKHGHVQPSRIGGAQFLHVAVPGVSDEEQPDMTLTYTRVGDEDGYRQKVYGGSPEIPFVSMANVEDGQRVPAWNLKGIYEQQWLGICGPNGKSVNGLKVGAAMIREWLDKEMFSLIVSTVPRHELCLTHAGLVDRSPHSFLSQTIHIVNDEDMGVPFNTIAYDGTEERSWYRSSNICGVLSTEWGEDSLPRYFKSRAVSVRKPISHTCDCWDDEPRIVMAGRYGRWRKGVLVQDGFVQTWQALEALS